MSIDEAVRFRVERTKVAIVGLGSQGLGITQVLGKTGQVEIVAVADINKRALEKAAPFVPDNCLATQDPMEIF